MLEILFRACAYLILLTPDRQAQMLVFLERAFREQEKTGRS